MPRRRRTTGRKKGMPALWIAAIMIAIPLFVVYYAFNKALPFASSYTDYVVVPNSVNVRVDSPVRIAGIDVGAVTTTEPAGTGTKIAFTLDGDALPIHQDATVTVRDRLFLEGGYYLQLNPGSPSAPVAPEGFTIQRQNTSTPVQFFQVLSTFDLAARANLNNLLNTSNVAFSPKPGGARADSGAGGFKQAIPALTPVLKDTAWISQSLTGTHAGDVERLLRSSADVFGTLAENHFHLGDLVTGLNQVSTALASSDGALAQSVSGIDQTLQAAPPALTAIDRALPPLDQLAGALTPTLQSSPPLLRSLNATVAELLQVVSPSQRARLISALNTTLASFPSTLRAIGTVFPTTKPVTDCLRSHIVPMLTRSVPDGALSSGLPVWKDFVHMLPSLSAASSDFDANGPYIRVLAGAGSNSLTGGLTDTLTGVLGQLKGIAPGGGSIQGSTPKWFGTLTNAAFRPDVECTSQALPSLSSPSAAPDLTPTSTPAAGTSPGAVLNALAKLTHQSKASLQASLGAGR